MTARRGTTPTKGVFLVGPDRAFVRFSTVTTSPTLTSGTFACSKGAKKRRKKRRKNNGDVRVWV
jgi:hypothetical protein